LSALHILMALILFFDLLNTHKDGKKDWIFSAVYFIAAIFLLIAGILNKKILVGLSKHLALLLFEFMLIISGAVYYWSKGASFGGAIVLLWIYFKKREDGEKIIISEANIILPGLAGDRIVEWNQLTNVIKKDDLLTLDFKNNRLLQVQVINSDLIREHEFNQFCQHQLKQKNQ